MEKLSKNELVAQVKNLNVIIENINTENCYDEIVKFFTITSVIQDRTQEIKEFLPTVKGIQFCGWRSAQRKKSKARRLEAEKGCKNFMYEISKAGRNLYGYNRTKPGEDVTKDKIFFGNIGGLITLSVKELEKHTNDVYVQENIRNQITEFVKSYKNSFNTDWLYL